MGYPIFLGLKSFEENRMWLKREPVIILEDIHVNPNVLMEAYRKTPARAVIISTARSEFKELFNEYDKQLWERLLRKSIIIELNKEYFRKALREILEKVIRAEGIDVIDEPMKVFDFLDKRVSNFIHLMPYINEIRKQRKLSLSVIRNITDEKNIRVD